MKNLFLDVIHGAIRFGLSDKEIRWNWPVLRSNFTIYITLENRVYKFDGIIKSVGGQMILFTKKGNKFPEITEGNYEATINWKDIKTERSFQKSGKLSLSYIEDNEYRVSFEGTTFVGERGREIGEDEVIFF